jgi:hypothetical protein
MSKEVPLQHHMFSGEWVDARSDYRRRQDRQQQQPRQTAMFSAHDTVQFGISPRPWLKEMPAPPLALEIRDVRTEEEKEREWRRAAEALTVPLFAGDEAGNGAGKTEAVQPEPPPEQVANTVYVAPNLRQIGFRADARRRRIPVRWKGENASHKAAQGFPNVLL